MNFTISESRRFMRDVKPQPNSLLPEQFCGGYISAYQFYNQFHAGFCAPYICNPNYMLIVDFRQVLYTVMLSQCYTFAFL